jgi:hypothetical protein
VEKLPGKWSFGKRWRDDYDDDVDDDDNDDDNNDNRKMETTCKYVKWLRIR